MYPFFISVGVIGLIGILFFKLIQWMIKLQGGSQSRIKKDKEELRLLSLGLEDRMVPTTNEELALLSSKMDAEKINKGVFYTERGALNSIYEEPIVSYSYRDYGGGKSILLASTQDSHFEFIEKSGEVKLKINDYLQGTIQEDGTLLDAKGNLIAEIDRDSRSDYRSLTIRERKVAELLNPTSQTAESNKRVFLELKPLNKIEQNILLGMTIYNALIKT